MEDVINILKKIETTTSRTKKELILKDNENNDHLKLTLQYTFNPYLIYGIGQKSFKKFNWNAQNPYSSFETIFKLLDYLMVNNTGSDHVKSEVNKFLSLYSDEEQKWYKRIILKDLKCGITAVTINKIWPSLIPTFDVMLAKKFEDHEHKIKDDFVVTLKLDGVRCAVLKENGNIKLISRQGKLFEDLNELTEELIPLPDNTVYDGELLLTNDKNLDSADLYRETMKEVSKIGEKHKVEFHCFDIIPIDEFKSGQSNDKCIKRKETLHQLLQQYNFKLVKEVPVLYKGKDKSEVFKLLDEVTSQGGEGLMVNQNMPYLCKRSDAILKVKKFSEADVLVLDVIEGTGKNEGKLGSILIQFEHEGNKYTCNVGSGFSDVERIKYFENPKLLIGKIVTVGYFELSQNQNDDGYSMRFPTWKSRIREDKTEISMN